MNADGHDGNGDDNDEKKSNAGLKLDICKLKDMLEAKVNFLCQDRPAVAPVQMIQIQLEVVR